MLFIFYTIPCTSVSGFCLVAHCSELILLELISDSLIGGGWKIFKKVTNGEGTIICYSRVVVYTLAFMRVPP